MQTTKQKCGLDMQSSQAKHILGVIGSPRKGANTETLVDTVLAGAAECGAATEKVILQDLEIAPCRACDYCRKNGKCIHDDDMELLLDLMVKSDIWVLGTPIYWWGPSAQFKAFIDRWYGLDQRIFQGKGIILTIPMGGANSNFARHTEGMMKDICHYLGMEFLGSVIAPNMDSRNAVRENTRILDSARSTGIRIVKTR